MNLDELRVLPNGVLLGLDALIGDGKLALTKLRLARANPDEIKALEAVNEALAQSRLALATYHQTTTELLHNKDAALERITAERDEIADAFHDQTAIIDDLRQTVEECEIALTQWSVFYQEHQS